MASGTIAKFLAEKLTDDERRQLLAFIEQSDAHIKSDGLVSLHHIDADERSKKLEPTPRGIEVCQQTQGE